MIWRTLATACLALAILLGSGLPDARAGAPADKPLKKVTFLTNYVFHGRHSPFFVGLQLVSYDALGDWRLVNTAPERADAVTAADIQRVAREYLGKDTRTVATFRRKEDAPQALSAGKK